MNGPLEQLIEQLSSQPHPELQEIKDRLTHARVYLTRRNLLALLSKLDRAAAGDSTACAIIKHDLDHPTHPQSHPSITVHAVEDQPYYADRAPGALHPKDEP